VNARNSDREHANKPNVITHTNAKRDPFGLE